MVKMDSLVDRSTVKKRRERLGLSQGAVAERVKKLSGKSFSQQAMTKFENGGESAFSIYILRALDELEDEAGISFISPDSLAQRVAIGETSAAYDTRQRAQVVELLKKMSANDQRAIIEGLSRELSVQDAAWAANLFAARVLRDLGEA